MQAVLKRTGYRFFLNLENLFTKFFGHNWNPIYHLGSLTFFFFWVVLVSGIYLFVLFETNVEGAYPSVEAITQQWWLAGIMRSLHRYASDAAVVTIFLHLLREYCRDRYRGVRWFSWFTGVPTLWLTVLLGISGYWLVWDQLAQYVALSTAELLDWIPFTPGSMTLNFLDGQITDRFFTLMAFLHLLGFPVAMVFMLWTHVSRISNVDFNPPFGLGAGSLAGLLVLSLIAPAVSHDPVDFQRSVTVLHLDWFYLNVYPLMDRLGPAWAWGIPTGLTFLFMFLPWLPPKKDAPPAKVNLNPCNGCGQCAVDCPFGAVSMQPRSDGRKFRFEAVINDGLCTACGICVGACPFSNPHRQPGGELVTGIDMPGLPMEALRKETGEKLAALADASPRILALGCQHGAGLDGVADAATAVVMLPCSGMTPPSLVEYALGHGADGVFLSGCRDGDCFYRLGNQLWDQRQARERKPFLSSRVARHRIHVHRGAWGETAVTDLAVFRAGLATGEGRNHD